MLAPGTTTCSRGVSNTTDAMKRRVSEAGKLLALENRVRPEYEHMHGESVAYVLEADLETSGAVASLEEDGGLVRSAATAVRSECRPSDISRAGSRTRS
jgi:hypothetical protein